MARRTHEDSKTTAPARERILFTEPQQRYLKPPSGKQKDFARPIERVLELRGLGRRLCVVFAGWARALRR
jgi:hypothetical protein